MIFTSHWSNFVDADPAFPMKEFKNIDELLKEPWISGWNEGQKDFAYYWAPSVGRWPTLMVMYFDEQEQENKWWVLGYMDEVPNLPQWKYEDAKKKGE